MARRRPLVLKLFIGFAAFLAVSIWMVASIEPTQVSSFLQSRLSQALNRPVTLGETKFNFSQGLAFEIRDVAVGTLEGSGEQLEIPSLFVKPRILPLFIGRLKFAELLCESPRLVFDLNHQRAGKDGNNSEKPPALDLPFQILSLSNGSLKIVDSSEIRLKAPLIIEKVQGYFRLTIDPFRARLAITGELIQDDHICPWSIRGHVTQPEGATNWAESILHLEANHGKFLPGVLLKNTPFITALKDSAGSFQTQIRVNGTPAKKVEMEAVLTGEDFSLAPNDTQGKRIAIEGAHCKTEWAHTSRGEVFDNIDIAINQVSLTGNALLENTGEGSRLKAQWSSSPMPLSELMALYPGLSPAPEPTATQPEGTVQVQSLAYEGPLTAQFADLFQNLSGRLTFANGRFPLPATTAIEGCRFEINLAANRLSLEKGYLSYVDIPWEFHGSADNLISTEMKLRFEAESPLPAEKLMSLPALSSKAGLMLTGTAPVKVLVEGGLHNLKARIKSDFSGFSAALGDLVFKGPAVPGDVEVRASTDYQTWNLEHAHLVTDLIQLQSRGHGRLGDNPEYQVEMVLHDLDMKKIPRDSKLLQRLQPKGAVSYIHNWQGGGEQAAQSKGVLTLKNADFHLTNIIADLKSINATVNFFENRAEFHNVMANLGSSPLMISGTLERSPAPVLNLRVVSPRIRADELIFPNDQSFLYDLDGNLTIDKNQIRFNEVHTALGKGTVATVKGYVTFSKNPETRLQISSKNAVIDEVIDLWGKTRKGKKQPQGKGGKGTLLIDVEAEKGVIDRFHFQNASGQIRLKDNILVIHPLDFHSGPGDGNGQVLVVNQPGRPSLLKISGHLENFDAEAVSKELLRYGHLVSGTLRGDFHLEGRTGKIFLPTSKGEFNIEIRKGVLKKFNALSKVFSILNVSQLFSLKLPDMATDGMPFKRATGTIHMHNGLLTSENIWVDSEAMNLSVVGSMDLVKKKTDTVLGVKPLGTVDKIITHIPIAGYILAGEDKALVTAYFDIKGDIQNPVVEAVPMASISNKAKGIFKRIFGLPEKVMTETKELFREKKQPEQPSSQEAVP
ncbi:MAG: AsmA-like C-terminal domain-containing protein [Deltaproteobacteria bacterium]|nr:AsmA-like C-terminal domain-containing protein [Deltaproteobacteria bacterium]